jgi:hypothetical protein
LCNVVFFLLGIHSDPEKYTSAQWPGFFLLIGVLAAGITLGIKARRAETPPTDEFGYGQALGAGVLTILFAALFGVATSLLYSTAINPQFSEVLLQAQALKLEARGLSADKIEQIQKMSAMWMSPVVLAISGSIFMFVLGTIVSLIAAAFLKRPTAERLPSVAA